MNAAVKLSRVDARKFRYGCLRLSRLGDALDENGSWVITTTWKVGSGDAIKLDGTLGATALLDQLGADGWELVGPPEVQSMTHTLRALDTDKPGSGETARYTIGNWIDKRFYMRRAEGT